MTGLDTRVGYPNEHLGKSKVDAAKSPMYATTVGLVLSGFKALDMREERYEIEKPGSDRKKQKPGNKFFSNILEKTKGLLIDDFDDKIN